MLISADASQIEWRTAVFLSQDKVALEEILDGADTHSLNQVAFKLPSRLIAKIYLFRTIFRGSGYAFSVDNDFMHVSSSPKFWDNVNEKFYEKYYGLDQQHKKWADLCVNGEPIVGPFGREWSCPLKRNFRDDLVIPWTTLSNYPIQGTAADVMMVARISFSNRLKKLKTKGHVKLILTIHDSIVCDVEYKEDYQLIVNLFHQVFDDLPANINKLFGIDWNVPQPCECKIGLCLKDKLDNNGNVQCETGMTKIKRTDK